MSERFLAAVLVLGAIGAVIVWTAKALGLL